MQNDEYKRRMENLAQELETESRNLQAQAVETGEEIARLEAKKLEASEQADEKTIAAEEVKGQIEAEAS